MDQNEFRQLQQSGGLVTDAALQEVETDVTDDREETIVEDDDVPEDTTVETTDGPEEEQPEDEEELPPAQKDAFTKRMERERAKLEEKLRKDIESELEGKYSKHKQAIEAIGGDPDKILEAARESQMQREAQRLAEQNGWSDEETRWYVEQQKQQQELKELRVQMQINRLRDNADYAGISSMEKEILAKIDKTGGALSVEEAYWALGGPKRIEQMKLEEQQRSIAKRQQQPRTVLKDSQSSASGEKPLPANVLREAERMGISADEARRLMSKPTAQNIDEWRASRKAK